MMAFDPRVGVFDNYHRAYGQLYERRGRWLSVMADVERRVSRCIA